jgi:Amt family ammonium transporter
MLDKLKIDDVVGAIPVPLICGIWGTLAVVLSNGAANIGTQLYGIAAIGIFTVVASAVVWFILAAVMGIRVSEEDALNGLDMSELGMEAYPEFQRG